MPVPKMNLYDAFVAAGDEDENASIPASRRLVDYVLDQRPVDDRQHLLSAMALVLAGMEFRARQRESTSFPNRFHGKRGG